MKTTSIYRSLVRDKRVSFSAQWALEAGVSRGRRDASLAEARETSSVHLREFMVERARHEHKMFLSAMRAVRMHERIATEYPVAVATSFARHNAAKYSQHPKDASGEWPF